METIVNGLGMLFLLCGSLCNLVAGIGIFYFPDLYTRMHAASITDALGTGLIFVGLMLHAGLDGGLAKLLLILIFTLITSPTISYVLANTAQRASSPDKADDSGTIGNGE